MARFLLHQDFHPRNNVSDNHSLTNDGSNSTLLHTTNVQICILCVLLPIPIFAIMGNLFIMAAVARFQSLQTPTNAFVVSLAVADFLVAVLVMPFSLVRSIDGWHFGHRFCQVHFFLDVTLCTSSIFNLSCVAMDRYVAVCDPLHYPARMSPRRVAVLLLLLCWVLPLVISSLSVSLGMYTQSPPVVVSSSAQQYFLTCMVMFHIPYAFLTTTVAFFVPMAFMLFAYGKIFLAAQKQARWIHAIEHHTGQLQMNLNPMRTESTRRVQVNMERYPLKKERKAAKTLGLIMGAFLLCWLPFFCINVIHPLKGYNISPVVLEATLWLGYANSSLNPFLYILSNKTYRHVFVAMFDCGILGRHLRACFRSSHVRRQTHTAVILETISR